MLVFGVEMPLVEIIFGLSIISMIMLVEIIIVVILLMKALEKAKGKQ